MAALSISGGAGAQFIWRQRPTVWRYVEQVVDVRDPRALPGLGRMCDPCVVDRVCEAACQHCSLPCWQPLTPESHRARRRCVGRELFRHWRGLAAQCLRGRDLLEHVLLLTKSQVVPLQE